MLAALLDAAAHWLRERGCDRMVGPMDLSMNDECGILIEGHELRADHSPALAAAVLPAAERGGGTEQGDGPAAPGISSVSNREHESCCRSLEDA